MSSQPCGCDPEADHHCERHAPYGPATPPLTTQDQLFATDRVYQGQGEARKTYPVASGVLDYFPLAIMEVAHVSYVGNQQHHPDKPLHWDKSKSFDEADALLRHFLARGTLDTDGIRHTAKVCWRALALLERELEQEGK